MYCTNCGAQNDANATRCANCGNVLQRIETPGYDTPTSPQFQAEASIPNYLVPAILTTLFCCLPAGIVSIVYAAQVDGKVATGDRVGALQSSANAKAWAWISFGAGFILIGLPVVLFIIITVIGAVSSGR